MGVDLRPAPAHPFGMATRLVVGCMTGTSIDALDVALVEIEGKGLEMTPRVVGTLTRPLGEPGVLLRTLANQEAANAGGIAGAMREFSLLHAAAISDLLREAGVARADLIAVHGQTIFHSPPLSWQLFSAAPVAQAFKCPVVFDLRAADLAAGGQGAPITPLADWILFRHVATTVAVVNLGGFCNVTLLRAGVRAAQEGVQGRDLCACSQLLDAVARAVLGAPFDRDGAAALRGSADVAASKELAAMLTKQASQRRSLGTGDELGVWIQRHRARLGPDDLARSAAEALGSVIAASVQGQAGVLLAGGGTRNACLVASIHAHSRAGASVQTTDGTGIPAAYREAICMAVLGALCQDRVPITLPQVTGVPEPAPVAGCWVMP
jgi:anhydro-N-acetylmuramic acid kinase